MQTVARRQAPYRKVDGGKAQLSQEPSFVVVLVLQPHRTATNFHGGHKQFSGKSDMEFFKVALRCCWSRRSSRRLGPLSEAGDTSFSGAFAPAFPRDLIQVS